MPKTINRTTGVLLYLLSFIILWQCVKPVTVLTILQSERIFFVFVAVSLLLSYLNVPGWINFLVNGGMILYSLHYFYFQDQPFFSQMWMKQLGQDLFQNAGTLWQGNILALSDLFVTFVLFVLLWLVSVAMRHWLSRPGHFLLFFFLALLCLSILDAATFYEAGRSIVIVVVAGLAVLGIQKYRQIREIGDPSRTKAFRSRWFAMIVILSAATLLIGFVGPKPNAQWTNPPSFLEHFSIAGSNANNSIFAVGQRIGYDEDDSRLGGSLGMDTTRLFTVRTSGSGNYWRVAEKDVYTGKGWDNRNEPLIGLDDPYNRYQTLREYESDTPVQKETATFAFSNASPFILPYTGQLTDMRVPGEALRLNQATGQILTDARKPVPRSDITYLEPTFQIPKLRNVKDGQDPQAVRERNLQLPSALPNRVRALAHRLTDGKTNRYDQAMAVVDYLRSSRFTYSTDRVPRPSRNQDYVDQFLFESKIGYCDNFSTSMAVLLRSAGIPARWVKGFSAGTYMNQSEKTVNGKKERRTTYEITNANAHSWVEVYFPGSGWVTFEPTPSFDNPSEFADASNDQASSSPASSQPDNGSPDEQEQTSRQQEQPSQPENPDSAEQKQGNASNNEQKTASANRAEHGPTVDIDWRVVGWIAGSLSAAAVVLLALTRKKWLAGFYLRRQKNLTIEDSGSFNTAYVNLLRILALKGIGRSEAQTLREYAETVDRRIEGSHMLRLTKYYESMIYSDKKELSADERKELNHLCGSIVGRLHT
ncbi:DUF4129 domain-containing protein [Sporolactobacillus sp. THM7-7]|nr:DUF4129 domain-containing protein [Sporolactobacillus sp. THM7-7]